MGLIQTVKRTFGMEEPTEMHRYECGTCYAKFDVAKEDPALVTCESCGSSDVSRVTSS